MAASPVLRLDNVRKTHPPQKVALDGITLEAPFGVLGLLGPNGAGKSSLMEILAANLDFEEGRVTLDARLDVQRHPRAWRRQIGYMPQGFDLPAHTSGREVLCEGALLLGLSPRKMAARIDRLVEQVNLTEAARREAASYSRGMKQRLGLALALLHQPTLLLLDEPTAGLDPVERVAFRESLFQASRECIAVVSTHIVRDVERCADRIAVIDEGKLVFHGSPPEFEESDYGHRWQADRQVTKRRKEGVLS